jgi:hypothetical protein
VIEEDSDCSRERESGRFDGIGSVPYDENQSLVVGRSSLVVG